jgi:iron complex transport system permease protein
MKQNLTVYIHDFQKRKRKEGLLLLFLFVCLLMSALLILMVGNTNYSLQTVLRVLFGEEVEKAFFTIRTLRLPRLLCGILAGAAFGMAGSTFQNMLRNPLASPDMIGISAGSSVAAVFSILVLQQSGFFVSMASLLFGLAVAALIYFLSHGSGFSGGRLILMGIGVQAMLQAVISYLLLKANQYDVPKAMRWLSGSLNGMVLKDVPLLTLVVFVGLCLLLLFSKQLKALELGDEYATSLGVQPKRLRLCLMFTSVLLIAFATSITGPISFVAFLAGPIAKKIVGNGANQVLPSALTGALLVLLSDFAGQFLFETRFPVGVITGLLGAPYLVFLLIRINKKGGFA